MNQEIIEKAKLIKKTMEELDSLLNLPTNSDIYNQFLEMHSTLNVIMGEVRLDISDQELFSMYIEALVMQGKDIRMAIKNKSDIIPLLRIIDRSKENSIRYNNANKAIIRLTTEKPSFWKQVFNLKG